jgi:phosphatidylglycerol:prolipoprotein diacylglycerol transferase
VHKIALQFGSFTIHWYGVLVALGFLAGIWTASRRSAQRGIAGEKIVDIGTWLILGGIVGARVLYVISYWDEQFANKPLSEIFMIQHGGLVFYGGLIGATLTGISYAKWKKLPVWRVADILAPSIALGHVFGRMGCLMNGCCYGHATGLPWAVHYPVGHETYGTGVHPTQVYESLLNLALFIGLVRLYRKARFDGEVFAVYLIGYALLRAFVETFRGDYPVHYLGGLATPAQLVSAGILATGLILYWKLPRPKPAETSPTKS